MHLAAATEDHHTMLRLARLVEDCGYFAASYSTWHERDGLAGELAAMLDLGKTSPRYPRLIDSPEFGDQTWRRARVSDAPLDPTPPAGASAPTQPRRLDAVLHRAHREAAG